MLTPNVKKMHNRSCPIVKTSIPLNLPVPPSFNDLESSPSTVSVRENNNASLVCKADGTPMPDIRWKREDKKPIIIKRKKKEGKKGLIFDCPRLIG